MTRYQTPVVTSVRVVPVAGQDSMLLNLSGAHAPFFTRNIVLMEDSAGHTGLGEVPGGEGIRKTIEDAGALVVGQPIGHWQDVLNRVRTTFESRCCPSPSSAATGTSRNCPSRSSSAASSAVTA